jgi:hypothetical protein
VRSTATVLRLTVAAELIAQAAVLIGTSRFEGRVLWTVTPGHGLTVGDVVGLVLVGFAALLLRSAWQAR